MKKVCIVTTSRSEYGLLRWTIDAVHHASNLELQLVVSGTHLMEDHGFTCREIEADGYPIAAKVKIDLTADNQSAIAASMGECGLAMAKTFAQLHPDLLVVLGDRYELIPICSTALVMCIPIAHISGGDVTVGAIDNEIRNAVTMIATLHFPGVEDSAKNIVRMRNSNKNVWTVGEPGLENFRRSKLMTREELASNLSIPVKNKWVLVTLHPETMASLNYNLEMAKNIVNLTNDWEDTSIIITKANADYGGPQINDFWETVVRTSPEKNKLYPSLGQLRYLSFMNQCDAVIGNSSSGIVEAPYIGIPVINIGHRQEGRHLCDNVIQVENDPQAILEAWKTIEGMSEKKHDSFYGDGHTSERILTHIEEYLYE